jgi:tRNA-uridine 2-sulfurtransferase
MLLNKRKVVVAMSGGVDSSVAAALLLEKGYEVIGISLKTHNTKTDESETGSKTCCSVDDLEDARRVCQQLDIPFYPLNYVEEFKKEVMDYFAEEYARGRTPNPCVKCNDKVKFAQLLQETKKLGAYYLATGHYARCEKGPTGKWNLYRGADEKKDQSYFLFNLQQEQLEHVLFPLGDYTKEDVRKVATQYDLKTADKGESQEICFVPKSNYAEVLEKNYPHLTGTSGEFVDPSGQSLGTSKGVYAYTIGQRRGLGVAAGQRQYVTKLDPETHRVVLGTNADLMKNRLLADQLTWVNQDGIYVGMKLGIKIRYHQHVVTGYLNALSNEGAMIDFEESQRAITPGQAVVFYRDDEVLGGGWIKEGVNR